MSTPGQDRFANLVQAAKATLNGAVPLGKPKAIGQIVIHLLDTGESTIAGTTFDGGNPGLVTTLLVNKVAADLLTGFKILVNAQAPPPGEG